MNSINQNSARPLEAGAFELQGISGVSLARGSDVLGIRRRFYNTERPHQGIEQRTPEQMLKNISILPPPPEEERDVEVISHLGGLLKSYRWKAAA